MNSNIDDGIKSINNQDIKDVYNEYFLNITKILNNDNDNDKLIPIKLIDIKNKYGNSLENYNNTNNVLCHLLYYNAYILYYILLSYDGILVITQLAELKTLIEIELYKFTTIKDIIYSTLQDENSKKFINDGMTYLNLALNKINLLKLLNKKKIEPLARQLYITVIIEKGESAAVEVEEAGASKKAGSEEVSQEENDKPYVIYMIGKEDNEKIKNGYICTFLHQYELYKEYCIINDDRFLIICNEMYDNLICNNDFETKANSTKLNRQFPDAITKYIIFNSMDKTIIITEIKNIINTKINNKTPIIFLFEGHGPIEPPINEGELILSNNIHLTTDDLSEIFLNYKNNIKLFLFTQCGSFGFYNNLINNDLFNDSSYIIITGINKPKTCAIGAGVLIKFPKLIKSHIYEKFIDLKNLMEDNTTFTLQISENNNDLFIKDIFYKYKNLPTASQIDKLSTMTPVLARGPQNRRYTIPYKESESESELELELELVLIQRKIAQYITNIQVKIPSENTLLNELISYLDNLDNLDKLDNIIERYEIVLTNINKSMFTSPANENIKKFIKDILQLLYKYSIKENLKTLSAGNKPNTFIEINKVYEYYYNITNNTNIIELSKIFTNYEIIYLLLLIMNSNDYNDNDIFKDFFINLQESLNNFYDSDVLLLNHYDIDEIIYYIFINNIYDTYKSLLQKSSRDIYIIIKNDKLRLKTVDNYRKIYNTLNGLLKNPNKEFINFLKKNLKLNETYEKTKDSKYLLTFIYKYSKLDEIFIKGYDSFLTYLYLNILYKFSNKISINYKKYENNIPSLYIYNFSDLREKKFEFELTSKQQKMAEEIMNNKELLLSILGERYNDYSKRPIKKINTNFTINAEILEYLNSLNEDKIFDDYKSLPIIDYSSQSKNDDIKDTDDIISNIIIYASYLYRDDLTAKEYSKLVKYYLLGLKGRLDNRILNFAYEMIYMMNKRINKIEIENNLIRELSTSQIDIDIKEINKYKNPEKKKITINILEILNYYYDKINYNTMITYLSQLYKYDEYNKFQNKIQDLLYKKNKIYGGLGTNTNENKLEETQVLKHKSTEDAVNTLLTDERIKGLENNIDKITNLILSANEAEESNKKLNDSLYIFTPNGMDKIQRVIFTRYDEYKDTDKFNNKLGILITETNKLDEKKTGSPSALIIQGQLKTKRDDIKKIQNDLIKDLNKFSEQQIDENGKIIPGEKGKYITEFDNYLQPLKDLLERIENTQELHTYPLIKRIYNDYILYKDDKTNKKNEKSMHPEKLIDDFREISRKILENNLEKIKILLSRFDSMIDSLEAIIKNRQNQKDNKPIQGGGLIIKGGNNDNKDLLNKLNDLKKNNKLSDFVINLKKLKGNRDIKNNVEKTMATPNFIDKEGLNLFDRLLESYDNDYNNKNIPHEITKNKFYNRVKNLNLDPEDELKITLNDKIIFAVLIYIIRIISLYICYYFIDKDQVTNIRKILISHILWYITIFVVIVFIINIDTFKFRILVNYMNLHINSFNLLIHLALMGAFIYLIYSLIYNIDGYDQPKIELTDNEKIKLKYKLDLLTIFIYIFICILLFVI